MSRSAEIPPAGYCNYNGCRHHDYRILDDNTGTINDSGTLTVNGTIGTSLNNYGTLNVLGQLNDVSERRDKRCRRHHCGHRLDDHRRHLRHRRKFQRQLDRQRAVVFNGSGNQTFAGAISGTGSVTVGTTSPPTSPFVTLSDANTYTGKTTVTAGTLTRSRRALLPGWSTNGNVTVSSARRWRSWSAAATGLPATSPRCWAPTTWLPAPSLGLDTTLGKFPYAGAIGGSLNLVVLGNNILTLSGRNTYTGTTVVSAGTLERAVDGLLAGL